MSLTRRSVSKEPGELSVFPQCRKLISHTLTITNNLKRYPKKIRFSITNRIQDDVLELYSALQEANEIYPNSKYKQSNPARYEREKCEREALQRKALVICKRLLFFIDLSIERGSVTEKEAAYWAKLVLNVKYFAASWMKKDRERF